MFFLVALLAFINCKTHFSRKEQFDGDSSTGDKEEGGSSSGFSPLLGLLIENINDLLNNGLNKEIFYKYMDDPSGFLDNYHNYIDYIVNESYVPFPGKGKLDKYNKFINADMTVHSISTSVEKFLKENKETFKIASTILSDLGPDVAKAANIDYSTIKSLYDYILINDKNDGAKFGEILKILGISSSWAPQIQKIVSVFDAEKPLSLLFEGLNVKTEYQDFVSKVKKLDVPSDNTTRFISVNLATDALSSLYKLVRAAYNKCLKVYYDDPLLVIIKKYALKASNIFEDSIYDRATSLNSLINKVQKYETSCDKEEGEGYSLDSLKCLIFGQLQITFGSMFCPEHYDPEKGYYFNETCVANIFDTLKGYISDYTASEINLTDILINKYDISENWVLFFSRLAVNLTDSTKNYHDILKGTTLILPNTRVLNMAYPDFVGVVTNTIEFISTLSDSSNFKIIFDYFNLKDYWTGFIGHVSEISSEKPICNLSYIDEYDYENCNNKVDQVKHIIDSILKGENFTSLAESEFYGRIINMTIPVLRKLGQPFSQFLQVAYDSFLPMFMEIEEDKEPQPVQFSNAIKKITSNLDEFITLFDDLFPLALKELPVVDKYYPLFIQKTRDVIKAFNSDSNIASIANTFYDGIGVIFNMLNNAGNSFKDDYSSKIIDVISAAKPTTFINLQETLTKLSKVTNYTLKSIAESITYDGSNSVAKLLADSRTLKLNDVFPFKSFVLHSDELLLNLKKNRLTLDTISTCLAVTKDTIKGYLSSIISPVFTVPQPSVQKSVAFYSRYDDTQVSSVLEKIRSLAGSIAAGKLIRTQTNSIVVTPVATPAQTIEPIDDGYKPSTPIGDLGSQKFETPGELAEAIENKINDYLTEIGEKDLTKVDIPTITYDVDEFEFTDEIDLKGASLSVPNGGTITYTSGNLNLNLEQDKLTIKCDETAGNLKLSLRRDVSKPQSSLIIDTKQKSVHITSSSDLASDLKITVPKIVEDLTIDSVKLSNGGSISAEKSDDDGNPVKVNVKVSNLEVASGTKTTLSKVTISKEFKLTQTAKVDLKDVTFAPQSTLSIDLHRLTIKGFNEPLLSGTLKSPPQEITLNIKDSDNKPQANTDHLLFNGLFDGGCENWAKAIKIEGTDFNSKVCNESSAILQAATKYESLSLRNNQEDKSKGKKLTTGQIAGIAVGCVAAVAIVVIVVVVVVLKKKKNRDASSGENEDKGKKDDDEDL